MKKTLFAVYGSLKKGFHNHAYVRGAKLLGTYKTDPIYTLVSLGSYPAVKRGGNTSIEYELYETDNESIIKSVHNLEGYSGVRGSSRNWYDTDPIQTKFGEAEMFVMNKEAYPNALVVENGVWNNK